MSFPGSLSRVPKEPLLKESRGSDLASPLTVTGNTTESTQVQFVCLFVCLLWSIFHARTQTRETISGRRASGWMDIWVLL